MRPRSNGGATITAAATAASMLLLSAGGVTAAPGEQAPPAAHRQLPARLPQRRVPSPKRQVPYPDHHPLGRHLQEGDSAQEIVEEEEVEGEGYIVGGDGSRARQKQLQRRRRDQHRWLRFFDAAAKPTKRRRREVVEKPESIQELRLVENSRGETVRYWTISGRNLVEAASGGEAEAEGADGGSAQLLMNMEQINDENDEANKDEAYSMEAHAEEGRGNGGEGRVMEDDATNDDDFDAAEFESSNTEEEEQTTTEEDEPESLYRPIRLRAVFTDDDSAGSRWLTPAQRTILMEDVLNPALFAWSRALHVVPVGGGGRRRRTTTLKDDDNGNGGSGDDTNLVVDSSQLYDGVSCGPGVDSGHPSVRVPRAHTTVGLPDTDAVVYVSVAFAEKEGGAVPEAEAEAEPAEEKYATLYHLHRGATGPVYAGSATRKKDGTLDAWGAETNETSLAEEDPSADPSASPSHPPSFSPSDPEPYVASRPTCPGTYLASSMYCSTDQYDRPVAGLLSLCITNVHDFFHDPERIQRNVVTVMHELGHVLGFNAQSLAHFRDADTGAPLTPRDGNGDVLDKEVECTGVGDRARAEIPLPSKEIVKFRSVRGGVRAATIVTPTVRRVARNMFGCRTLAGAELQSGEGQLFRDAAAADERAPPSPGECIGDHWSRRLFRTDLMNVVVDDVAHSLSISSLTLAYFADSGWYKVDARRIAPAQMWGRNAGCHFAEKKCVTSNGHVAAGNNPFFCSNFLEQVPDEEGEEEVTEIHGCDLESSRKAVCSLIEYENAIPQEYDYFEPGKRLDHEVHYGGSDPSLDYCPVFEGFANGRCDDEESKELMEVRSSLEVFGEDNSRCVVGKVDKKRTAVCLPIACVIQEQSLMVKVDGYWKPCSYAGQIISVWWNPNDYVVCPDPSRMCPTFYCHQDCFSEGGICDYQTGQCMCATSMTNETAANSTSWFSNYYSYQRYEPCSGSHSRIGANSGPSQVVERIDFELPHYYVPNTTVLLDDPRDFDDKVSRMFSQLNSGEVFGLVASFMFCAIMTFIVWSQLVRCYKRRLVGTSLSKVRSSVNSLSHLLRSASLSSLDNDGHGDMDSPPSRRRPPGGQNPQKDKMVASLLVQMRTEGAAAEQEQQRRLSLGGLTTTTSNEDSDEKKANTTVQTIVDLSSTSDEEVLVNRSELPPLEGGRVLAVVGARIVEDEAMLTRNDDARSSATSATQTSQSLTAEVLSPLYQDDGDGRSRGSRMVLRLRRQVE